MRNYHIERTYKELGVDQGINLEKVVGHIDPDDLPILNYELERHDETAALFESVPWLAPCKNQKVVIDDNTTLDIEVLDIHIVIESPSPFLRSDSFERDQSIVRAHVKFEAILIKVNEGEERQHLSFVVDRSILLSHKMKFGESSGCSPVVVNEVVAIALLLLISSKEDHTPNPSIAVLSLHSRLKQFLR